jgi:hypothetical protein
MSSSWGASYGGKRIFSSLSRLRTRASSELVNLRSLEIPTMASRAWSSSVLSWLSV